MQTKSLVFTLTVLLLHSASGRIEKNYNGARLRTYSPQPRTKVIDNRFTSAILNKLGWKGKETTTTERPDFETTSSDDYGPTYISSTGPSETSETSATEVHPDSTSDTSGTDDNTGPILITSATSTYPHASATSSSSGPGDAASTTYPEKPASLQQPVQGEQPVQTFPHAQGEQPAPAAPDDSEAAGTSRAADDDGFLDDNDNDDVNDYLIAYNANHLLGDRDFEDDVEIVPSTRSRTSNWRRNQSRRSHNQPAYRQLREIHKEVNNGRRRRRPNRQYSSGRPGKNPRGRRKSSHRRRLVRRRIKGRPEPYRRPYPRCRPVRKRKNTYENKYDDKVVRYRPRPVRIVVQKE